MLIETSERRRQLKDCTVTEFLKDCDGDPEQVRRSFMAALGYHDVKLPSLHDAGNLDEFMKRLIERCAIVAPWELDHVAEYVKLVSQGGGPQQDIGFRLDVVIPDLIEECAKFATGDPNFWKDKKNMEAFVRAFPAAKAKYEKKYFHGVKLS